MTRRNALREAQASLAQAIAARNQAASQVREANANGMNNAIRKLDVSGARASKSRAEASLANAKTTLDQTVVRAPREGVVLQKYVEQGTIITSGLSFNSTGTSIVQLGDVTRMYVDVAVDETDIASVHEGQPVDVSVDAYPNVPFRGRVVRISPKAEVDQNVTAIHVRVELSNRTPEFRRLKPSMNATCDFVVDVRRSVLAVPSSAIQSSGNNSFVDIVVSGTPVPANPKLGIPADPDLLTNTKTKRQTIETGLEGNESTEILKGLKEGERVALQRVQSGGASNEAPRGTPFGGPPMGPGMGGGRMGGRR